MKVENPIPKEEREILREAIKKVIEERQNGN